MPILQHFRPSCGYIIAGFAALCTWFVLSYVVEMFGEDVSSIFPRVNRFVART